MTLYAHRSFVVTADRAKEDGTILTMTGEIPIKKGELYCVDLDGNAFPITETRFKDYYVPVQRVEKKRTKKQLSPFEELYTKQLQEFNGTLEQDETDLHKKNNELVSDKAF